MLRYWGKASKLYENSRGWLFHPLFAHSVDVMTVAKRIALLNNIKLTKFDLFFIVMHDIGKMSCGFQCWMDAFSTSQEVHERYYSDAHKKIKKGYNKHHSASGCDIYKLLVCSEFSRYKFIESVPEAKLSAVFGHHGLPVKTSLTKRNIRTLISQFESGTESGSIDNFLLSIDYKAAISFFSFFINYFDIEEDDDYSSDIISWDLAGLTCLADWIASNSETFPYVGFDGFVCDDYISESTDIASKIPNAMLIFSSAVKDSSFKEMFGFDTPTPLQKSCDTALIGSSGIYFMEDSTGAGKTEAALRLAQKIILYSGIDGGVFFALPSKATSNSIYKRILKIAPNMFHSPEVILSHGDAKEVNIKFASELKTDNPAEYESFMWLSDNRKKCLLSHFGVGTIDSVLAGILPLKHQALRMFGLKNKVLILDEVHSYDVYMTKEIETLIYHQAKRGGSVIITSATLSRDVKKVFALAYAKGASLNEIDTSISKSFFKKEDPFPMYASLVLINGSLSVSKESLKTPIHLIKNIEFIVESNDESVLNQIKDCVSKGGNVCVIKNTVNSASYFYDWLRDEMPDSPVTLFHSRFIREDRLGKENIVMDRFGKLGKARGEILVATQVAEQSLDIDFDLMITDLAPAEYLIQRAGRCHRHIKGRPEDYETPKVIIIAGGMDETWLSKNSGTRYVYYYTRVLWLTFEFIMNNRFVNLPAMSREFVEYSYNKIIDIPEFVEEIDNDSIAKDLVAKSKVSALDVNEGYSLESDKDKGSLWQLGNRNADVSTRLIENSVQVNIILNGINKGVISLSRNNLNKMSHVFEDFETSASFMANGDVYKNNESCFYSHERGLYFE